MTNYKPDLSVQELSANFTEVKPALTALEARVEAQRCLYCFDAPCIRACPTSIDVPSFIQKISSNDVRGAAQTIFDQNILGGSCARVCPTSELCEGACVFNDLNEKPIQIGSLQRFATDFAIDNDIRLYEKGEPSGKRVAIVGAGPAGLSCAHELSMYGHDCVVFEASDKPGGLNTTGIAGYKITTEFSLQEVEYVKSIGFDIKLNAPIGKDRTVESLLEEFDAVFLGIGLGKTASLGIEGEDIEGCLDAIDFIKPTREDGYEQAAIGRRVLVVGGGNTAIDCCTAAKRLGAEEVIMVYRRGEAQMPAYAHEYDLAKHDGIQFRWLTAPVRVIEQNGKVSGLECQSMVVTDVTEENPKGRLSVVPGSEHVLECDLLVKALGQTAQNAFLGEIEGLQVKKGAIVVTADTRATSIAGLYAGGDCINLGAEVVDAVEDGKIAAYGINQYLSNGS